MSVSMVSQSGSIEQWLRQHQAAGGEPFSLLDDAPSVDQISVDLPNGYKVSATHIGGGSAFNAQFLASLEDIVDHLSTIAPSGNDRYTPPPGVAPGQRNADGSLMEYRTLDSFHVELANGYSVDISHATLDGGGDNDAAAMAAMAQAIEQLVGGFGAYPGLPAVTDLRPDPTADLLPGTKDG